MTRPRPAKVGLALAGGGPQGAVYEIGALRALDEALDGLDFSRFDIYVGVSAGSLIAACLANGMTTRQLCRSIFRQDQAHSLLRETLFTPAYGEWLQRLMTVPRLSWESLRAFLANPQDQSLLDAFTRLGRALPTGVFDNGPLRDYLERVFAAEARPNDFRELNGRLVIVAADLDSGRAVRFGVAPYDHVPISQAVQASTALPGLYPPVEIDGRHYVDGVLLKTLHSSVALEVGARLLLCVNPIVPVDTEASVAAGAMRRGKLVHRGFLTVMSQTFRTLVRSRLTVGMASYKRRFPDAEIVMVEPDRDDYRMFFSNIFSFSSRRHVCEHAYLTTRRQLRERLGELEPLFAGHGIRVRREILEDEDRTLWTDVGHPDDRRGTTVTRELDSALNRLEGLLRARSQAGARAI